MKRPEHPDFWLLSRVMIAMDEAVKDLPGTEETNPISEVVDEASLFYLSEQRVDRALQRFAAGQLGDDLRRVMQMVYVDAFVTAARYQKLGGHVGTEGSQKEGSDD